MAEFCDKLREEIFNAQERRASLTSQKLAYVITTFGLGAITADNFSALGLLFLSPIIAFSFDLYIAGEDFGIKRAGGFLGRSNSGTSEEEKEWEKRVRIHYDPFSKLANPFVSLIVLLSSAILLWNSYHNSAYYYPWIILNLLLIVVVWISSHIINKKVREFEKDVSN